jgi:hypothetical protein
MGNKGLSEETREQHESFGMVGINRCSSSGTHLFGSIAKHHSFITLSVKRASVSRHLAQDWYHAESRDLIEIEMSHSQFAELITSPGIGDGVPCTIRAFDGKLVEECPAPKDITSAFSEDMKKTTKETVAGLKQLSQQLSQALLPGEKALNKTELKALLSQIQSALSSITDSMPFIEKQFDEHIEEKRDKMVGELEAIATHMLVNLGKEALATKKMLPTFSAPQLTEGEK